MGISQSKDARPQTTADAGAGPAPDPAAEAAAQKAALADALQQLEAFTYTISHDLRAPLRAIKGFTKALNEDYGHLYDDQAKDYSRRIIDGVEHMEEMISALLAYSRIGRGETVIMNVPLEDCLASLAPHFAEAAKAGSGTIEIARPLPAVLANPLLLNEALRQLISNAIKFVAPGAAPRVQINAEQNADRVRIKIKDNGIGIQKKCWPKLFQIFQRLNAIGKYPGLGIGLALASRAVSRMGGSLGFETEPGHGSTFWIELPAAQGE